jgi:hypothetical protein
MIKEALWQTGGDLVSAKTGIIIYIYIYIYIYMRCLTEQSGSWRLKIASRGKSGSMSQRLNVLIAERP